MTALNLHVFDDKREGAHKLTLNSAYYDYTLGPMKRCSDSGRQDRASSGGRRRWHFY